jgi:hypothetical protein
MPFAMRSVQHCCFPGGGLQLVESQMQPNLGRLQGNLCSIMQYATADWGRSGWRVYSMLLLVSAANKEV